MYTEVFLNSSTPPDPLGRGQREEGEWGEQGQRGREGVEGGAGEEVHVGGGGLFPQSKQGSQSKFEGDERGFTIVTNVTDASDTKFRV